MEQKKAWKCCLIIGINVLLIAISGCREKTISDPLVRSRWIYINETEHYISYSADSLELATFNIQPFDTIVYEEERMGAENSTADDYSSPLKPHRVFFGNSLCDTLISGPLDKEGEGPIGMNNYQNKKLEDRYYEFTFRFTKEQVQKADTCK